MSPRSRQQLAMFAFPALCLVMLGAVTLETMSRPTADDAEPYHRRVAQVIDTIPYQIGDWVGIDEPPPREAIALLRPNTIFSRRYENIDTREQVSVVLVHCRDARDLAGHYPPICYPAHGWTQVRTDPLTRQLGDQRVPMMRYEFTMDRTAGRSRMIVDNFLVLPDGRIVRDMDEVRRAAGSYTRRIYGAAQVQIVYRADGSDERREQAFDTLLGPMRDAIQTIRAGVAHP
ncbi:MAG: exosortase-associated EpsI family protein [Phycisphaeraceae bacterium]